MLVRHIIVNLTLPVADIIYMNDARQCLTLFKFKENILRRFQFLRREMYGLLTVEYCGI